MTPFLIAVIVLLLAYKYYKFAFDKPPNSPPSIPRVPISGSYLILLLGNYKFPHKTVGYFMKKLKTKILGLYLGDFWTVVANDYDSIKEVLKRDEFDGRITEVAVLKARAFGKKLGVTFVDGPFWQEQRRYLLRNLRDFGFGRRQEAFERDILDELTILVDTLKNGPIYDGEKEVIKGDLACFPDILYPTTGSSLWNVLIGHRFDRTEHDTPRRICRLAMTFQRSIDSTGGAIFHLPILRHFGNMFGFKTTMKTNYEVVDIIQEYIKSQSDIFGEDVDRGFIDRYHNMLNKEDKSTSFSRKQMIIMITDMFLAGTSTIPATATQVFKYLINHPKVMKKAQNEIDEVVGTGRLVTWEDRKNLPYVEAVIRESMRIASSLPFSLFHRAVKDTTLGGYSVPANTPVVTNLEAMHHDPDLWGDPENFRPERFINEKGELIKDMSLPFSFGHRVCPGETYSRYNLFGMVSVLIQNFNFYQIEGQPSKPGDDLPGLLVTPKEFWVRYEVR